MTQHSTAEQEPASRDPNHASVGLQQNTAGPVLQTRYQPDQRTKNNRKANRPEPLNG
jgi:hypothetical protein